MAQLLEQKEVTGVFIGDTKIRPLIPKSEYWINMSFDDTNTVYRTSDITTSSGLYSIYWWTTNTSGDWKWWWALAYSGTGTLAGNTPPPLDPDGKTSWWCLALKLARWATWYYTQSVQLEPWEYSFSFYYYNAGTLGSYATDRCWVVVNGTSYYTRWNFVVWARQQKSVTFTITSTTNITVSLWWTVANSWSWTTPTLFFDNAALIKT